MIGQSVPRVEDPRLLRGQGRYLADVSLPGLKHAAILRSPVAHARIVAVDVSAARSHPGVVAAFSGADLAARSQPMSHLLPSPPFQPVAWHVLATDRVRYVGEPVAIVVADDRYVAEDALELIVFDYDELPAVVDPEAATRPDAPRLYEEWPDNTFFFAPFSSGDVDGAFAGADGVLRERFVHHRIKGLPLEGHGVCARYDAVTGELLVHASNQQPHNLRTVISDVTGVSEGRIRVVAPDMGGGFGNKQHFIREEALIAVTAMQVRCPVSWSEDRTENLTASVHSREQVHEVEVAYRTDGRVLGLRARVLGDLGAPVLYFTGAAPSMVTATLLTGTYDIPNFAYELRCVVTNKAPSGAYRGFGQPQALFTVERVMDLVAEAVGRDPAEVRRLNMIPDEPRPFVSPAGFQYDTGSFRDQFEDLLRALEYDAVRRRQAEERAAGRLVGIGLASLVEATAPNLHGFAGRFGGFEMAQVSVQPDGHVVVHCGTKSQGQGHETMLAQVAAETFTVPLSMIHVHEGDTATVPYGMGTWGSRSAVMGGGAVIKASVQIVDKMRLIAAGMLRVPVETVVLRDGMFRSEDDVLPFAAVAGAAYLHTFLLPPGVDMGLSVVAAYDPGNTSPFPDEQGRMNPAATYSTAASAAVVEVDPSTGRVEVRDFVIVHDCGRVINPMIVEGQIQGGFAQGLGAVLTEEVVYSETGQPLTSSLLDYLIPTFGVPRVRTLHRETPSALPGGFRGAGEAATIAAPATIANAIADALHPLGVRVRQTNLAPRHVRGLLRDAGVAVRPLAGRVLDAGHRVEV